MTTIETHDVRKTYGSVVALDGVSLSVEAGEALGLIGTNGAGKTTLFRLLVGHERPDAGRVRVAGRDPRDGPAVKRMVGYLPERAGFQPDLTGREVLDFHARMRGVPAGKRDLRVERVLATVGLAEAADRRTGDYSNGMTRRLGLGTLLLGDPSVLLLDEPTASLDPVGVEAFHRLLARIRDETDVAVVVSSHVLPEVEQLCDRVAVLHDGDLLADRPVRELTAAVDAGATVEARLAEGASAEGFRDAHPGLAVERRGGRLLVECPRDRAYEVAADLRERPAVDGVEVRLPGLEEAFVDVVGTHTGADVTREVTGNV